MNKSRLTKIFDAEQTRTIDAYTIQNEPIASIDLMERAAGVMHHWLVNKFAKDLPVFIVTGAGNNGGDGLATARMLGETGYRVTVFLPGFASGVSNDCEINRARLREQDKARIIEINAPEDLPKPVDAGVVIDALFGSGLKRSVGGVYSHLINWINDSRTPVVSIDVPSGLFVDDNTNNDPDAIVKATYTLSLQFPKLAFFFAENQDFTGDWKVLSIGLHPDKIEKEETPYYYVSGDFFRDNYLPRKKFSHKGTFGHALLVSGCYGKMGAAVLASRACLKAGVGLLTTHVPRLGNDIMQTAVPEAMISMDDSDILFSSPPPLKDYNAIGIGPAIGCRSNSRKGFQTLINEAKTPMVIDADAINILGEMPGLIKELPPKSILTPHPREFARLTGQEFKTGYQRHKRQIEFAVEHDLIVVLKGAHTSVGLPDGSCFFNSTGNPGMATAGSGDVLTGIILSLLSQGYEPEMAALLGVYVHGLSGDLSLGDMGPEAITATDIIMYLGKAFLSLAKR